MGEFYDPVCCLILGYKTRLAALVLISFLIPTTLISHDFWHTEGVEKNLQIALFFKNVAIAGGLLYVVGCGAGRTGIDTFCGSNCEEKPTSLS